MGGSTECNRDEQPGAFKGFGIVTKGKAVILSSVTLWHLYRMIVIFRSALWLGGVLMVLGMISFLNNEKEGEVDSSILKRAAVGQGSEEKSLELTLTTGAFQLDSRLEETWALGLKKGFAFLEAGKRPDIPLAERNLYISLQGGDSTLTKVDEKKNLLFAQTGQLEFTGKHSALWLKPVVSSEGEVVAELGLYQIDPVTTEEREARREIAFASPNAPMVCMSETDAFAQARAALEQGKWWGVDVLFEEYGGKSYEGVRTCHRVSCPTTTGQAMLYVKQGDFIRWNGKSWEAAALGEDTLKRPLARVCRLSSYELLWELWDATGLSREEVRHTCEKHQPLRYHPEELFSRIRKRTAKSVTCRLGKKNILLKEGDWLLKTGKEWKLLTGANEVQAVLDFQRTGDLFIFDGLRKEGKEAFFCGTFFNAARTERQKVRVPIKGKEKKSVAGNPRHASETSKPYIKKKRLDR